MRVLLAAHRAPTRHRLVDALAQRAELDVVVTGFEALGAVEAALRDGRPFDLVLLELVLPGLDGIATAGAIARRHALQHLPPPRTWGLHVDPHIAPSSWGFDRILTVDDVAARMAGAVPRAA